MKKLFALGVCILSISICAQADDGDDSGDSDLRARNAQLEAQVQQMQQQLDAMRNAYGATCKSILASCEADANDDGDGTEYGISDEELNDINRCFEQVNSCQQSAKQFGVTPDQDGSFEGGPGWSQNPDGSWNFDPSQAPK